MDDTDQWASRIINELVDDGKTLDGISEVAVAVGEKSKAPYFENSLELNPSTTSKDYITGSPRYLEKNVEIFTLTPDKVNSVADQPVKTTNLVTIDGNANGKVSGENSITPSYKTELDVQFLQREDRVKLETSFPETADAVIFNCRDVAVTKPVENVHILDSDCKISHRSKEEKLLNEIDAPSLALGTDYDVKTTVNNEVEVRFLAVSEDPRHSEYPTDIKKDLNGQSENFRFYNTKNSLNDNKSTNTDPISTKNTYLRENPSEELQFYKHDSTAFCDPHSKNILGQRSPKFKSSAYKNKKDFTFSNKDLGPLGKASVESLKRIEDIPYTVEFSAFHKQPSRNRDRRIKLSNSLNNLDYPHFDENFVKKEMRCWDGGDGKTGNNVSNSNSKSFNLGNAEELHFFGEKNKHNTEDRGISELVAWIAEERNKCNNGIQKEKTCPHYKSNGRELSNITHRKLKTDFEVPTKKNKKNIGIKFDRKTRISNSVQKADRIKFSKKFNKRNIYPLCRKSKELHQNEIYELEDDIDNAGSDIITQRKKKFLALYWKFCSAMEVLFVRPFAIFLFESFDFVFFALVLFVFAVFYAFHQISLNMSSPLFQNEGHNPDLRKDSSESEYGNKDHLSEDGKIYKMLKDIDSFIKIEPIEVKVLDTKFEVITQPLSSFYDKGENYLQILHFQTPPHHRALLKTNEGCLVNVQGKRCDINTQNDETDHAFINDESQFDSEIIASSKKLLYPQHDAERFEGAKDGEVSCNLLSIPPKSQLSSEFNPLTHSSSMTNILSPISNTVRPTLNSTEAYWPKFSEGERRMTDSLFNIPQASRFSTPIKNYASYKSEENLINYSMSVNVPSFFSRSNECQTNSLSLLDHLENTSNKCMMSAVEYDSKPNSPFEEPEKRRDKKYRKSGSECQAKSLSLKPENCSDNKRKLGIKSKSYNKLEAATDNKKNISRASSVAAIRKVDSLVNRGVFPKMKGTDKRIPSNPGNRTSVEMKAQASNALSSLASGDAELRRRSHNTFGKLVGSEVSFKEGDKRDKKKGPSLKRRMSQILSNWRNMPAVQYMVTHSKSKKKPKKSIHEIKQ